MSVGPLTAEQAQTFAGKWAKYRDYLWAPLSRPERESLFVWVLDLVKTTWKRTMASTGDAGPPDVMLSAALSITLADARALFDAAKEANPRWPS